MECDCDKCEHEEERSKKDVILLVARIVVSLALALLGQFVFSEEKVGLGWNLLVMLLAYALIAYDIVWKAAKHILIEHEWFDENFLMVIASVGAFSLRAYGPAHNEFLEAILVIWLYQIGEFFSDLAADKSRAAIVSAIDIREEKALLEVNGKIEERKAEEIQKGDIVSLLSGRKIFCDGVVVSGEGEVNESSLTGEALPKRKQVGDRVYSGTLLTRGSMKVEASCDYEESTSAKLLELIESGAEEKSKVTRFITKFAKIYTPLVIVASLILAIVPPLFIGVSDGAVWARWIYVGLSLLVISCPCAIVISVPLAYFAGLGLASKNGILVKGASFFDKASALQTVVFDKTGTLTKGELIVSSWELPNEEIGRLVARAESLSSHPLAKAITAYYPNETASKEDHISELPGKGIIASMEGKEILIGNKVLLQEYDVQIPEEEEFLGVYVSANRAYSGRIVLRDELKANSKQTIADLHAFNVKSMVFSGDKAAVTRRVSSELGCDGYRAELLPEDKQNALRELKDSSSGMVAFCGDGINDAPTLALSDIGIAMGKGGADVALDNADVVLVDDDPHKVVSLIDCAKKTKATAVVDIVCSLAVKFLVAFLSLLAATTGRFSLPLWAAVLADSGLATIMVLFSLSLHFRKLR